MRSTRSAKALEFVLACSRGIQDYSLRSKNHNENKRRLKILRQKVAERNPDEFSYGMLSSQSRKGQKLADRQNPVLGHDVVKLLKTHDAGYVTTLLQKTKQARARLEQTFVLNEQGAELLGSLSGQEKGNLKVFVHSREEQRQYESDRTLAVLPVTTTRKRGNPSMNELEDDSHVKRLVYLSKDAPKSRRAAERQERDLKQNTILRKQRRKERDARTSKLAVLNTREKDLSEAKNELDLQRAKMNNIVGGTTKVGTKWRVRERKK